MNVPIIRFVFDRRHTASNNKKGSIDMVITYEKQRKFITTGVQCYPHQWKDNPKRNIYVSGTGADVELNQILLSLYQKAYRILSEQIEKDLVDISAIPTLLKAQNVDMTFLEYIIKRSEEKNVVEYTRLSYQGFYNKLSEYGKIKFFSDINERAIRSFDEWLHNYSWTETDRFNKKKKRKYSQATIASYHKNLKNFISEAVVDGYLKENVYVTKAIKIDKGKTRIEEYLTLEELEAIEKATMPTRSLSESRDLFLFQSYSGLSYVDLMSYDFKQLQDVKIGSLVHGKRHKTGIEYSFVITEEAKEILEKYKYRLPNLPNQKYNVKLKLIADAAGIEKNLTSHMARRTAGSIWLNSGIPLEVVSKCLGHSSIITTHKAYTKILDKTIIEAFKKSRK